MDSVFQHGSSSGYTPDWPDFLIAQQHLQVVADLLAGTTFQTMDVDPRADATASLSAIRAILSPESREVRAELAEEAQMQIKAKVPIGAVDGVDIGDTGGHSSVTAGDGMGAIGATDSAGIRPSGIHTDVVTDGQTHGTADGATLTWYTGNDAGAFPMRRSDIADDVSCPSSDGTDADAAPTDRDDRVRQFTQARIAADAAAYAATHARRIANDRSMTDPLT